jgi:hypothetical protein
MRPGCRIRPAAKTPGHRLLQHAVAPAVVLARAANSTSRALIVQRFVMTEFQYPSAPDQWFYAPQIQIAIAPGAAFSLRS